MKHKEADCAAEGSRGAFIRQTALTHPLRAARVMRIHRRGKQMGGKEGNQ